MQEEPEKEYSNRQAHTSVVAHVHDAAAAAAAPAATEWPSPAQGFVVTTAPSHEHRERIQEHREHRDISCLLVPHHPACPSLSLRASFSLLFSNLCCFCFSLHFHRSSPNRPFKPPQRNPHRGTRRLTHRPGFIQTPPPLLPPPTNRTD